MHARFPNSTTRHHRVATLLALAFLLAGSIAPRVADGQRGAAVPPTAAEFVASAAATGLAEVAMAQLAVDWAGSAAVRDFTRWMLADHVKGNARLETLARTKDLTLPRRPDEADQKTIAKLATLRGAEFDVAYLEAMQRAHEKHVALFESAAARSFPDPELRAFALERLPVLRQHLEMIEKLRPGHAVARASATTSPA